MCWNQKALGEADWAGGPDGLADNTRPVASISVTEEMSDGDVVTVEFPPWMLPVVQRWFESDQENAGLWSAFVDDEGGVLFNSADSDSPAEVPRSARPLFEVEYVGSPLITASPIPPGAITMPEKPDGPWRVGADKQLFIDRQFFATARDVTLKIHPARKTGEKSVERDRPWESVTLNWFSVLDDGGRYRMWYECYDADGWFGADIG